MSDQDCISDHLDRVEVMMDAIMRLSIIGECERGNAGAVLVAIHSMASETQRISADMNAAIQSKPGETPGAVGHYVGLDN